MVVQVAEVHFAHGDLCPPVAGAYDSDDLGCGTSALTPGPVVPWLKHTGQREVVTEDETCQLVG